MITTLLAIIGGLFALLGYQTTKRNTAEGQTNANKLSSILDKDDQNISKEQGLIDSEQEKQKETVIQKDSNEELLNFVNDPKPKQ